MIKDWYLIKSNNLNSIILYFLKSNWFLLQLTRILTSITAGCIRNKNKE